MNRALIYSLKLWSISIIGTPLVFITYIHLLAILPAYHVPELFGFIIGFLLPSIIYISSLISFIVFIAILLFNRFDYKIITIKLALSIATVGISYIAIPIFHIFGDAVIVDNYSYLLMFAYSTVSVAGIWFYKFKLVNPVDSNFSNS